MYMTVGNLKRLLKDPDIHDDQIVVISKDTEGNNYSPLSSTATIYVCHFRKQGLMGDLCWKQDGNLPKDALECVTFFPAL